MQIPSLWRTLFLLMLGFRVFDLQAFAAEPIPLELTPYQVELVVSWIDAPSFTPRQQQQWTDAVQSRLLDRFNAAWEIRSAHSDLFRRSSLNRMTAIQAQELFGGAQPDVRILVAMDEPAATLRASLVLFQPRIQRVSRIVNVESADLRNLCDATAVAIQHTFRPETRLEAVREKSARFRTRGGELGTDPPLIAEGSLLAPSICYYNKSGEVQRIQPIPWTYLTVQHAQRAWGEAQIHSGLRSTLGGKTRGRVELTAAVVAPEFFETELTLMTQTAPLVPLMAHRVQITDRPWQPPTVENKDDANKGHSPETSELSDDARSHQPDPRAITLVSDRLGRVTVPVDSQRPLVWVNVFSGSQVLARVPCVPGSEKFATLSLPDDSVRLKVEGELSMLQSQLVEVVAQRATVLSAIRRSAKENQLDRAAALFGEFKTIPGESQFLTRLGVIRLNGVEQARSRKQKLIETRITRMCDDVAVLIKRYLDPDKQKVIEEELKELEHLLKQDQKALDAAPRRK